MGAEAWQAWIAGAAVVLAGIGLFIGLRSAARARLRELENVYFERYWKIIDQLDHAALTAQQPRSSRRRIRCCVHGDPAPDAVSADPAIRRTCVLYLRLCEDELRLRESGLVSADTWCAWKKGMAYQLRVWPVRGEWKAVRGTQGGSAGSKSRQYRLLRQCEPIFDGDEMKDPISFDRWRDRTYCRWRGATRSKKAEERRRQRRSVRK
ncbi:hypothetical protein OG453_33635 [Streptomyces sp. NBC_01381]|uniref:hypothetical protein n=1 Tax=Streptomyces sp. NBC_01381 TaxID=2903845 RepID=UPI00225AF40B|nr:hypothetical protein [Streptomyces sp. NBC_01381]MCX4671575.1 hypothetical protein [Streptomyces sp. NBC_01381]